MNVTIPYLPRPGLRELHQELRRYRFACFVMHRRRGKTTFGINHLQRDALTLQRPERLRIDDPPRVGFAMPLLKQARSVAWEPLKRYARPIPGVKISEAEMWVEYPNRARFYMFGLDNPDSVRGLGFDRIWLDEYSEMSPTAMPLVIRPMVSDREGHLYLSGTPKGRNAFYHAYEHAKGDPEWLAVMHRASETNVIAPEERVSLRRTMSEEQYEQEYECSFAVGVQGAYYARLMEAAEREGRLVTGLRFDPGLEVHTAWDIGIGDDMAIWFAQLGAEGPRIIDYYASSGVGIAHYVEQIQRRKDMGWIFGTHFAPHDAAQRSPQTGKDLVGYAADLGLRFEVLPRTTIEARIEAVRRFLPTCLFDADNCRDGLEALKAYRRAKNDRNGEFYDRPEHDWSSHGADAFGYLAQATPQVHAVSRRWQPIHYGSRLRSYV